MNQYKWFYKGKTGEVAAPTSYKAQQLVAELVNAKKSYEITVVIVQREDGTIVEHSTAML
jgi:hypothetical protein